MLPPELTRRTGRLLDYHRPICPSDLTAVTPKTTIDVSLTIDGGAMAIVRYSVPHEVKTQFDRAFARENKSSVIARLMMQAVEERRAQRQRVRAVTVLLRLRRPREPLTNKRFNQARRTGRP